MEDKESIDKADEDVGQIEHEETAEILRPLIHADNQDEETPPSADVPTEDAVNSPPNTEVVEEKEDGEEGDDDDSSTRHPSPGKSEEKGSIQAPLASENEGGVRHMQRFFLYETFARYYIIGSDLTEKHYRVLKIDRTVDSGELSITEDDVVYNKAQLDRLLATIEDGNIAHGGITFKHTLSCILGFIRFTGAYYMLVVTKKSHIAMIGGHYVYKVDATELVPISTVTSRKLDKNSEEARFMGILNNLDLTRYFYFSYSYDITRTLQHNLMKGRDALRHGQAGATRSDYNEMFAWNHYLLKPALQSMNTCLDWCMPLLYGFIDQAKLSVYGRPIYITIIARRSRYFAGARFLKRGANDLGYVANDVETEQIVSDMLTTSFHAPGGTLYGNPNYTSFVQHRGSIPLYWSQDPSPSTPKPPITLNLIDPFFSAAALHFDQLFERYGCPIIVLNLIKSRERVKRESILLEEFTQAITYLNQLLPKDKKIKYIAWDMSRASKSRDQDVIAKLESIAKSVVKTTGFFHNGHGDVHPLQVQNGVCRTNCIDCLDRTNAAQFVIGKRALGHQLHALGVVKDTNVDYDTDAMNLFTHMYHDHGDTIALQYGGSHLVNTMETYRKINQWTSHSRDMIESFKRYYNNSFLDGQRQEAINLFLGNYIFAKGQPMLWDLETDYYLHHTDPRALKQRRSYIKWWTPEHLKERTMPLIPDRVAKLADKPLAYFDEFWLEYYRPKALSTFLKVFAYNVNSQMRYLPFKKPNDGGHWDASPFVVRASHHQSSRNKAIKKRKSMKSVKILEAGDIGAQLKKLNIQRWLHGDSARKLDNRPGPANAVELARGVRRPPSPTKSNAREHDKDQLPPHLWNMDQLVNHSLNPMVSDLERNEYERYISYPHKVLPVVSHHPLGNSQQHQHQHQHHPSHQSIYSSTNQSSYTTNSNNTHGPLSRTFQNYVNSTSIEAIADLQPKIEDEKLYHEYVDVPEHLFEIDDETESLNLRFKAYQSWIMLKGFKQMRT